MKQVIYAIQRIAVSGGIQEIRVPADPREWYRSPQVVSVRIVGLEGPLPEEFIRYALAWGWRYSESQGRFYPTESE
jgi:hypothetical protein